MKKLLILAVLSVALNARAEDQFLYWMIGEGATQDGVALETGTYYARVTKEVGSDKYLNLFNEPDPSPDANPYGTIYTVDYDKACGSWETFAGFASGEASIPGKFFVELYSDIGCGGSSLLGVADLNYTIANITGGGMSRYDAAAAASTFLSVPEPTSGMLLLLGVAGLALRRRKMQRA